ncbi:MAG TPA: cation:proton antiporter, partial [Solirubrobacterales bacterium]|nr:cation:proton antiporter [Solirubrobacterales bacterium]
MDIASLPLAATSDTAGVLTDLFLVLVAAKLGDEVFKRIGQPAIVGEILGGVLVGPSILGWVEVGEVLRVFSELGVVFLLFWVGLETRLSEMREVGKTALTVGSAGVVLPFLCGIGFGLALGESSETSVFLGAALAATSAGITSATFLDLGIARRRSARTVLGAAVVDDILALILLSVAVGMAADGGVDAGKILLALVIAIAFVGFVALGGTQLLQRRPRLLEAPAFAKSPLLPAVILCLGLAAFAA